MDQFDKALNKIQTYGSAKGPANILVLCATSISIDSIRASLEVAGHSVFQVSTLLQLEKVLSKNVFELIITSTDSAKYQTDQVIEATSLLSPGTPVVGFSKSPTHNAVIDFVRSGGVDFYCMPSDLNIFIDRIDTVLTQSRERIAAKENSGHIFNLCKELNNERHRVAEENDELSNDLANASCETTKKMQQVAIGAEFQTLVSQELDVESMLRTALEYMLTRVGAMNAAVYLREGDADWGIGAFINYDRQKEQFQSLVDVLGPAICPLMASEHQLKRHRDGETFANWLDLDPADFSGSEVLTISCFYEQRCMAVMVLFRSESRPFDEGAIETIETLSSIFGHQLGTIMKIHSRAKTHWPSESIDDDDWKLGKAA